MGEERERALSVDSDSSLELEFHRSRVTSDAGLASPYWNCRLRKIVSSIVSVAVAIATTCYSGCADPVSQLTTKPASWAYVEDAWGGMALGKVITSDSHIALALTLGVHDVKRVDSGICVQGAAGTVRSSRLLVRLNRSVCGSGSMVNIIVRVAKPRPGIYAVVYDDEVARYPRLGEVRVE
ncbi:MAG TPA: hypothetical protein VHQ90_05270 [Thermoanaerobaculia bacterium]|nr:hypothetical protein [Thermoanaerobaculia bacterium]